MSTTAHRTQKSFRLSDEAITALAQLVAASPSSSENSVVERMIIEAARSHELEQRVMGLYAEGKDRWADVLERLRQA